MKTRTTITTIAAALACSAAAAGPAQAANPANPFDYKSAKFKVEVEGVQTTAWTHAHTKQFACDSNSKGEGTEVVRFASRPKVVQLFQIGNTTPLFRNGRRIDAAIDLLSTITRRGTLSDWGADVCSHGNGTGGETPPPPDCGTKRSKLYTDLRYSSAKKDFITLEQSLVVPLGPFRNCPVGGLAWPSFLDRTNRGEVGRRLPARALFGASRKHIVIATGRSERRDAEDWHRTTIRYSIALTRIGRVNR
jgi:hypothetical protein